jgi:type II secretory pathway pseudopilin PulG
LLELLMVVVIIGILASIAAPQYFKAAERARAAEALQMLATIRSAEIRSKAQSATNVYASDICLLDVGIPGSGCDPLLPAKYWTYATAPPTATATRFNVPTSDTIRIDLDTGAVCTSAPQTYGFDQCV